jgi:hypothetical protein
MKNAPIKTESVIRRVAGTLVLSSFALGWFLHPGWYLLAVFVGANLLQSSFTGVCPLEILLERRRRA